MTVRLGIVVADFNEPVTSRMEEAAEKAAEENDAEVVEVMHVPGSYDTPLAADRLARQDEIDAVAVLGAIIKGDTDHDQVIADAAAQGLTDVSLSRDTPVALGITGPGMTAEEAGERIDYGYQAAESAIEMAEDL
ncbi:MAG: 6,7-dimethyl-8-ribityllumazine synthase [Candidatus Nanohaloarchaea archaeon]